MLGRIFAGRPGLGQIIAVLTSDSMSPGSWIIWLFYVFLCVLLLFIPDVLCEQGLSVREKIEEKPYLIRVWVYLAGIFCIIIFGAYGNLQDTGDFIYFQF